MKRFVTSRCHSQYHLNICVDLELGQTCGPCTYGMPRDAAVTPIGRDALMHNDMSYFNNVGTLVRLVSLLGRHERG